MSRTVGLNNTGFSFVKTNQPVVAAHLIENMNLVARNDYTKNMSSYIFTPSIDKRQAELANTKYKSTVNLKQKLIDAPGSPAQSHASAKKSVVASRVSKSEAKSLNKQPVKHLSKEEYKKIQEDINKEKERRARLENEVKQLKDQMSTI